MSIQTTYAQEQKPGSKRYILPFMHGFYEEFAQPLAFTGLRVAIGAMLMVEGYPKIMSPFGQIGFVENLGFYPGWLFSPMLAVMQFFGGFMIMIGLLTRPVALANGLMLLITLWFHYTHPYGEAFLTPEGLAALKTNGAALFTPQGLKQLGDGGHKFLEQMQGKAEFASMFWAGGALLFAAFGGGAYSVDRALIKREF
ncbi:putative oxidoreductase [Agrobacterium vitis]|nr:putative oxidoreductase [Agrobacterium vitis]MBE1436908.1 putative oxidoreductase [Agrobacterium vitis]